MPPASRSVRALPFPAWFVRAACLLGLLAVGVSALHLSAYGLANYLNSDFLTPYFFCSDLLSGRYPISGWTLSASPYFVPDHLLLGTLLAGLGRTGMAYALFTPCFYLALFVLAGFCVRTAVGRAGPACVGSLLLGNVFLAMRALPGHARCLWWIGAPTCHGGVLLLGFVYLWILGVGLRRGRSGLLPAGLFCVGFVGMLSDSLFLFQVMLPAGVALFLGRRRHPDFARWSRRQGVGGVVALLCAAALQAALPARTGWFYFSRIIRVVPTPAESMAHPGSIRRLMCRNLLRENWGFALILLARGSDRCLVARAANRRRERRHLPSPTGATSEQCSPWTCWISTGCFVWRASCIMLPLPILSCGWKDANNVRYLFNWLVLPGFLLTLEVAARWDEVRWRDLLGVGGGLSRSVWRVPRSDCARKRWVSRTPTTWLPWMPSCKRRGLEIRPGPVLGC